MSADKELMDTVNLCTSEDAFERFQADSVYEDDELLTLSDIVPPQPVLPDISNELLEIPYDNEVVLTSTLNDSEHGISAVDSSLPRHNNQEIPFTVTAGGKNTGVTGYEHQNIPQSHDSENANNTVGKSNKRGGKRKKQFMNRKSNKVSKNLESQTTNSQPVQDSVDSTTVDKNGSEVSSDAPHETLYPRRTRRERIPNTSRYPLVSETQLTQITSKRRPGRPKKMSVENISNLEPDSTNTENSSILNEHLNESQFSEVDDLNSTIKGKNNSKTSNGSGANINDTTESETDIIVKVKKGGKKGKKKKDTQALLNVEHNIEDSNISSVPENSQDILNESNQFNENNINEDVTSYKKVGKRGRKKKKANQNLLLPSDNLNNTISENKVETIGQDNEDDDADDICLSNLKKSIISENSDNNTSLIEDIASEIDKTKINSEMPFMTDLEYNVDKVKEASDDINVEVHNNVENESLLVEDTNKRPIRRKIQQNFKYDEESDEEDPFANVELSDDDGDPTRKKKGRYYSDDEYVPGGKKGKVESSSSASDSDIDDELLEGKSIKRKKTKHTDGASPKKKVKKSEPQNDEIVDISQNESGDLEESLKPTYISADETLSMKPPAEAWATSNEFENFIAQKIQGTSVKIQKVSSMTIKQSAPIEIPVIEPKNPKKLVENFTQTNSTATTSTSVQTGVPYDIPMKTNVKLTPSQSEKACEFLNSVVKTTSELGQLMKEKSEDFMKKKINTSNVTDTFKMDYCVRKSFLLFKLAKHNLVQMEEDLAKQYDEFLKDNSLSSCREEIKNIQPKEKPKAKEDSDSDCEIVEVKDQPSTSKKEKPKFNPKTVFLNKELSIKIAKKPTAEKKLEIKARHAIWINDSVMVKKVKPSQSFLAQDSRNKKPPDSVYVTEKMVSDFFEDYYRQKAVAVCARFVNTEWSSVHREYACHYFVKSDDFSMSDGTESNDPIETEIAIENYQIINLNNPKSLVSLCADVIQVHMHVDTVGKLNTEKYHNEEKVEMRQPHTLFRLCYKNILLGLRTDKSNDQSSISGNDTSSCLFPKVEETLENKGNSVSVPSLNTLCYKHIAPLLFSGALTFPYNVPNGVKSLSLLCLNSIQIILADTNNNSKNEEIYCSEMGSRLTHSELLSPSTLKCIAYEAVKHIMMYKRIGCSDLHKTASHEETINYENVTTNVDFNQISIKQEACQGLQATIEFDDEADYDYDFDNGFDGDQEDDENEWASQVQMQELRSCVTPVENASIDQNDHSSIDNSDATSNFNFTESSDMVNNLLNEEQNHEEISEEVHQDNTLVPLQVKLEPRDEPPEHQIDASIVKTEPVHAFHGMTIIPESIVTKCEMMDDPIQFDESNTEPIGTAFDREAFEQLIRCKKIAHGMDEYNAHDEIFSQSALRVRREHEPDPESCNDMNLDLLVPQTFEPLQLNNVKDSLMESSSDEDKDSNLKKGKKKPDKKGRGRPKKGKDNEKSGTKELPTTAKEISEPPKEKAQNPNEVTILTRRMREKIRQEEKKIESSESDTDIPLSARKEQHKKDQNKSASNSVTKTVEKTTSRKKDVEDNNIIQCNNVDSTAQIIEKDNIDKSSFTGFSAIDQNEITTYQKYMKFVYDKIMPEDEPNNKSKASDNDDTNLNTNRSRSQSPLINPDEPVELLECEPTMPILEDEVTEKVTRSKRTGKKKDIKKADNTIKTNSSKEAVNASTTKENLTNPIIKPIEPKFIERNGWLCYDIDHKDQKLFGYCHIPLNKLPESFVDTYLEYHDITKRDKNDAEIDRLINLQTLNRAPIAKDFKSKKLKDKRSGSEASASQVNSKNTSRSASPANSERYDELTPSEDEGANVEDETPPPVQERATENSMAKNLLMDDHDSDSDSAPLKPKEENNDSTQAEVKRKPGPKSKTKLPPVNLQSSDSLMLTADKMMNKELTLLHAPINLKHEVPEIPVKEPSPKDESKIRKKSTRAEALKSRIRAEDDSSSEEEKQWVSTKEKLLKRLGKKEDASVDDAKRAKLVTEFIEKRGATRKGRRAAPTGGRRSKKKFLEQQKQLRVLSKELLGEPVGGKRGATDLFKGRRNIRKVIDKKSLQRGTVLANMEEFERKRRLNAKQTMLRELHGCEEGVNVLVINDEVCLEYDFLEHRPVVTVHPFFTKVMKAHQYEGVKFMWDACFESLSCIEAGHGGGGCILAHCMGLGKTLQVLALLHTVLTHPRVGMQRVLVCCPLSTVLNWVDEIHKWIGPVTDQIKVFELSKLRKTYERAYQLEDWYNGGGIFIIGYELFRSLTTLDPLIDDVRLTIINKIRTALLDPGPDIVICDEGHLLKNDCSVLAVAMSRVVTKRRIILTGTPMQNNLREYYCMVNFVKPNLLGTYSEYSNRFENPIMNGQHRDSQEEDIKLMKARTHILHKVLEGCLQRQEASVLYPYLPKKHEYTVFIPLTECQWDLYKHYVHNYTKKSKQSVLKDFHILQKIWSHPQVLHNFQIRAREEAARKKDIKAEKVEDDLALEDKEEVKPLATEVWWLQYVADGAMLNSLESSNKFIAVFRILKECIELGDKVLIFSTSLFCLDALEYFLQLTLAWSLGQDYYRLDGSVPPEVRQKWCREFNADNNVKTKLFLISTRAGCLGLNMTAANRVIILDTSWNPAHDIQSIFRVYRFGQKKDCYIYRLVAMGTMEQKIYERSVTKQAVACRVVDEQQIDRHYNMAELTELYRFDEYGASVAGGVAVGVSDVALLRVARDEPRAVHAVHEHDSLLRGSAEQNLPEHERAAAWMQFQQEHAHKRNVYTIEHDSLLRGSAEQNLPEHERAAAWMQFQQEHAHKRNVYTIEHDSLLRGSAEQNLPEHERAAAWMQFQQEHAHKRNVYTIEHDSLLRGSAEQNLPEHERAAAWMQFQQEHAHKRNVYTIEHDSLLRGSAEQNLPEHERAAAWMQFQQEHAHKRNVYTIEHDSLLRGSAEQNLPEHERAAAWMQFQQEHAHKQMQNDIDANKKAKAIKKIELREKKAAEEMQSQIAKIKTEEGPIHDPALISKPGNLTVKGPKGKGKTKIVNCRIPVRADSVQPGPSNREPMSEDEMVRQITHLLIKHNFTKAGAGTKQIANLVNNVKTMVATGKPMSLGPGYNELTASIASVLTRRQLTTDAPPSTVKQPKDIPKPPKPDKPRIQANSKTWQDNLPAKPLPEESIPQEGRSRRRAAIAAEKSFEIQDDNSQDSQSPIIQLDDDWIESDTEIILEPSPPAKKTPRSYKPGPKSQKKLPVEDSSSILVSDDEVEPARTPKTIKAEKVPEKVPPPASTSEEHIILHPSLLSNQNFIKIVAHTYLAGNPMLDEDAATLAAQYSTLKALKELESTGKPIESGPIYDIALKVLGKEVLKKLQNTYPKSTPSADIAIPSIMEKLRRGANEEAALPAPPGKPKVGPKSKVTKPILIKRESVVPPISQHTGVVPVGDMINSMSGPGSTSSAAAADECILPDDEAAPAPRPNCPVKFKVIQTTPTLKPVALSSLKHPAPPSRSEPDDVESVASRPSISPAPPTPKQFATISLDSDDEDSAPPSAASPRARGRPRKYALPPPPQPAPSLAPAGPVPVALTGPNSQSIPLSIGTAAPVAPPTSAAAPAPAPVPVSLTGPGSRPVPISLTGPGLQTFPFAGQSVTAGPAGSFILTGTDSAMTFRVSAPVGPDVRPVGLTRLPAPSAGQIYLMPISQTSGLTRVSAGQVPAVIRMQVPRPEPPPPPAPRTPVLTVGYGLHGAQVAQEINLIDDEESDARPVPAPSPARQASAPPPRVTPTGARASPNPVTSARKPTTETAPSVSRAPKPVASGGGEGGRKRRVSSSSSSGSSRASSPDVDPLSILKDVVHIQAPERAKASPAPPRPPFAKTQAARSAAPNKPAIISKAYSAPDAARTKEISQKINKIMVSMKNRGLDVKGGSAPNTKTTARDKTVERDKDTVDLTESTSYKPSAARAAKPSGSQPKLLNKLLPPAPGSKVSSKTSNTAVAPTVVGTSKSIVLDGKSKSLTNRSTADNNSQKSVLITNVKTIQSGAKILKIKQEINTETKRSAAPPAKKKKTEFMTLKDFDIDDIDDIIELD